MGHGTKDTVLYEEGPTALLPEREVVHLFRKGGILELSPFQFKSQFCHLAM